MISSFGASEAAATCDGVKVVGSRGVFAGVGCCPGSVGGGVGAFGAESWGFVGGAAGEFPGGPGGMGLDCATGFPGALIGSVGGVEDVSTGSGGAGAGLGAE